MVEISEGSVHWFWRNRGASPKKRCFEKMAFKVFFNKKSLNNLTKIQSAIPAPYEVPSACSKLSFSANLAFFLSILTSFEVSKLWRFACWTRVKSWLSTHLLHDFQNWVVAFIKYACSYFWCNFNYLLAIEKVLRYHVPHTMVVTFIISLCVAT